MQENHAAPGMQHMPSMPGMPRMLSMEEEQAYLSRTMEFLREAIRGGLRQNDAVLSSLTQQRRTLWQELDAFYAEGEPGVDRLGEMLTNLEELNRRSQRHEDVTALLRRFRRSLLSPYFARVDFRFDEESQAPAEPFYIGRASLMDEKSLEAYVYDWRSPVASLFYRHSPGPAAFEAPDGDQPGEMTLKRQFQIKNGKLLFYVDSDLRIADELLAQALAGSAQGRMHSIVETIQRRQDEVIRDSKSEILLVQGAAGSGKSAVALHRVAWLLYEGHQARLDANGVLFLSPSDLFAAYIADVLPELGEDNIRSLIFEDLISAQLPENLRFTSRLRLVERLNERKIPESMENADSAAADAAFWGSPVMVRLLERLTTEYARRLHTFADLYYDGACIMTAQRQKAWLLQNPYGTPPALRLRRLLNQLWDRVEERKAARGERLRRMLANDPSCVNLEEESRRLGAVELARLRQRLTARFSVDTLELWQRFLTDDALFARISRGLPLPENIGELRRAAADRAETAFTGGGPDFADAAALLFLQLSLHGPRGFDKIRQLVIDEAQDLSPLQYAALRRLLPYARVTAVGDEAQSLAADASGLGDYLSELYGGRRLSRLTLEESYRSSAPITALCNKLTDQPVEGYPRPGEEPRFVRLPDADALARRAAADAAELLAGGAQSVALICRSLADARELHRRIALPEAQLVGENTPSRLRGILVLPVSLAKGLEFDAALVCGAEDANYRTPRDRRLLYVACTRALHVLRLYAAGEPTRFLAGEEWGE